MPLTVLKEAYIEQLEKEGFPNPNFRAEKLMNKKEKDDEIGNHRASQRLNQKVVYVFG